MTDPPMRLAVIIASARTGRFGETIGRWFFTEVQQHDDLKLDIIDRYDTPLPDNLEHSPHVAAYAALIDAVRTESRAKPVGFVS